MFALYIISVIIALVNYALYLMQLLKLHLKRKEFNLKENKAQVMVTLTQILFGCFAPLLNLAITLFFIYTSPVKLYNKLALIKIKNR